MTIQEICRNVEDLLRNDKGRTNFSPAARYAVRMLLDYAERASALEASRCGGIRMDAVKFVEERRRMFAVSAGEYSLFDMNTRAEDVVKEVEEWSAAHPRKTRQSVFLEQYPEAQIDDNDVLSVCLLARAFLGVDLPLRHARSPQRRVLPVLVLFSGRNTDIPVNPVLYAGHLPLFDPK